MCKMEGVTASMRKVSFDRRGYIGVHLDDGRIIYAPLKMFPDIKRLTPAQRDKWSILDGEYIVFYGQPETYPITDFLTLNPPSE